MATLKEAQELTQQLEELASRLHSELADGDVDFTEMMRLADNLGESADALASTFAAIDEVLMQRLPGAAGNEQSQSDSGSRSRPRRRRQQQTSGGNGGDDETKDELLGRAKEAGIEGRSGMSKDELRKALSEADSVSKEELLERAREADIPGRSEMSKDELKKALQSA